jgi:serine/threonine-protein kinase
MEDKNELQKADRDELRNISNHHVINSASLRNAPSSIQYERRSSYTHVRYAPNQKPRWILPVIIVGLILLITTGVIIYLNRGIGVIDLTNWKTEDAQNWARTNGINLRIQQAYNDQYNAGTIFIQNVHPGARINKSGFITISVSLGHDPSVELPLPDIMSMSKDDIDKWVSGNYLSNILIVSQYNDTVEEGKVISYEVTDNTVVDKIKRSTPIEIVISKGKEDPSKELVTIPDLRGKTVADCNEFANQNGIILTINEQYDDFTTVGTVISQNTETGTVLHKGDGLTITVSKGPKIIISDFSVCTKDTATSIVKQLNVPNVISEQYSSLPAGKLISQSIKAGDVYKDGETLQLMYSLGNQIMITSFIGQTYNTIVTWSQGLNNQGAGITINPTYTKSNSVKDTIIGQNKTNTYIDIGSTINVTVSLGKAIYVPDFVGSAGSGYDIAVTQEKAQAMCANLNIVLVFVEAKKSGRLPGEVWYQSIKAGKEVTEGTTITLKYNPDTVTVTVPDFKGMTQADIMAGTYNMKLYIVFSTSTSYVDGYGGKVYQQSLAAGSSLVSGSEIILTVSPDSSS